MIEAELNSNVVSISVSPAVEWETGSGLSMESPLNPGNGSPKHYNDDDLIWFRPADGLVEIKSAFAIYGQRPRLRTATFHFVEV